MATVDVDAKLSLLAKKVKHSSFAVLDWDLAECLANFLQNEAF